MKHLSEEFPTLCFAQSVPVHNVVEELSPWTILQHHVDFCVSLQNLIEKVKIKKIKHDFKARE